jgi:hypothetical protein
VNNLKILIIGRKYGGPLGRVTSYKKFLESKNHVVSVYHYPGEGYSSKLWWYYTRGLAFLSGHERRHMKYSADRLEKVIRQGRYDAVICIEHPISYVLTRDLGCVKIFSYEAPEVDELYYSNKCSPERIAAYRDLEIEIMQKSDFVVFPWKTTEDHVRKNILNGNNFVTLKYGCYPKEEKVSYTSPTAVVFIGTAGYYWVNRDLISILTKKSPFPIDLYGRHKPPRKFHLNYKGFADSLDILRNYQFGLNTVCKGPIKFHSSKILTYLSYGLPSLSPDWLQFSHELKGVLPFNENNFVDLVHCYSDQDKWEKLSAAAFEQAHELDWNLTLQPLEKMISK